MTERRDRLLAGGRIFFLCLYVVFIVLGLLVNVREEVVEWGRSIPYRHGAIVNPHSDHRLSTISDDYEPVRRSYGFVLFARDYLSGATLAVPEDLPVETEEMSVLARVGFVRADYEFVLDEHAHADLLKRATRMVRGPVAFAGRSFKTVRFIGGPRIREYRVHALDRHLIVMSNDRHGAGTAE